MRFKNETVSIVRWNKSERKEKIVRKKKIDWNWQRMKFITQVRNIYLFFPIIFIKIYFSILLYISRVFYSNMLFLLFLFPCSWSTRKNRRRKDGSTLSKFSCSFLWFSALLQHTERWVWTFQQLQHSYVAQTTFNLNIQKKEKNIRIHRILTVMKESRFTDTM